MLKHLLKTLRFFNLLEPGRKPVLSISNIFAWLMLITVIIVLFTMPDNIPAVIAAAGAQTLAMLNYSFKRYVASKKKNGQ